MAIESIAKKKPTKLSKEQGVYWGKDLFGVTNL